MNDNKADVMRILKSLGANYPIIRAIGYEMTKPVVVITAGSGTKEVMECVTNFTAPKIGEDAKLRDLEKALAETNSEFLILLFSATRKGREQINFLISAMKLGTNLNALPLIISDGRIQREDVTDFFMVYLGQDLQDIHIPLKDVVPPDEQVEVVLDKITEIAVGGKTPEEKALLAAVCFLYPNLKKENRNEEFGKLVDCAKALAAQDEEGSSIAGLGEMFVTEIFEWQEKTGFCDIHELPMLEMNVVNCIDRIILFDACYFHLKESLLADIAKPLLELFPMDVLKATLVEDGMLCPENSKTYTTKVNYCDIVGNYQRIRMLRFNRAAFNRFGELEFIDLCCSGAGGATYA